MQPVVIHYLRLLAKRIPVAIGTVREVIPLNANCSW
jgi:hypothetical protein